MARVNPSVCGMGVNVPASMLPRSTSTPVIMGQYNSVEGVGGFFEHLGNLPTSDSVGQDMLRIALKHLDEIQHLSPEEADRHGYWRLAGLRKDYQQLSRDRKAAQAASGTRFLSVAPKQSTGLEGDSPARVDAVGIAPIIILGLGALGITGGLGYLAGRSGNNQPSTLTGEIGKQVGSGIKWAALGFLAYTLYSGKNPLKEFLKK